MTEYAGASGDRLRSMSRGWKRRFSSVRVRLVGWFVLLLAVATFASVMVVRGILLHRVDQHIDSELVQEATELRKLARGNDPETGRPFEGRVRKIFQTYLQRNVPSQNEALITFVDGRPYLRSRRVEPYRLDRDPRLVESWGDVRATDRGGVDTPAGAVEYLAVPVRIGGETKGVFVVAIFRDLEREDAVPAILGAGGVGLVVLAIGALLAWGLADRVLTPVSRVSDTARSISESDLSKRIEVEGSDEIAQLAERFNDMLDRLGSAFETQRHFVDDASHELRTPITVIRGQLELLEDDPAKREKTLGIVMDELDRMSRFVDDLLLLSRAERPDFLDLSMVDVGDLVKDLFKKSSGLAERTWSLETGGPGLIVGDRQRLTQAVMQLAQNAVQFTTEGDEITIGSTVQNGWARFWVRDTGPGIPAADQTRIFGRFTRGGGGHPRSEGAGLGLSIVEAITQAHHGRVELLSRPGEGSQFTLILPTDQPVAGEVGDP